MPRGIRNSQRPLAATSGSLVANREPSTANTGFREQGFDATDAGLQIKSRRTLANAANFSTGQSLRGSAR